MNPFYSSLSLFHSSSCFGGAAGILCVGQKLMSGPGFYEVRFYENMSRRTVLWGKKLNASTSSLKISKFSRELHHATSRSSFKLFVYCMLRFRNSTLSKAVEAILDPHQALRDLIEKTRNNHLGSIVIRRENEFTPPFAVLRTFSDDDVVVMIKIAYCSGGSPSSEAARAAAAAAGSCTVNTNFLVRFKQRFSHSFTVNFKRLFTLLYTQSEVRYAILWIIPCYTL